MNGLKPEIWAKIWIMKPSGLGCIMELAQKVECNLLIHRPKAQNAQSNFWNRGNSTSSVFGPRGGQVSAGGNFIPTVFGPSAGQVSTVGTSTGPKVLNTSNSTRRVSLVAKKREKLEWGNAILMTHRHGDTSKEGEGVMLPL